MVVKWWTVQVINGQRPLRDKDIKTVRLSLRTLGHSLCCAVRACMCVTLSCKMTEVNYP